MPGGRRLPRKQTQTQKNMSAKPKKPAGKEPDVYVTFRKEKAALKELEISEKKPKASPDDEPKTSRQYSCPARYKMQYNGRNYDCVRYEETARNCKYTCTSR